SLVAATIYKDKNTVETVETDIY
ncbi:hypothetical protein Zm00014a_023514, partial [Zea mays]